MSLRGRSAGIAFLRREIARIEARGDADLSPARPGLARERNKGAAALSFLSAARLAGDLHEIVPASAPDAYAALEFALRLAASCARAKPAAGVVLAVEDFVALETGAPYGPGLLEAGVDPARLVIVRTQGPCETLRVMEEALKCPAVAAVLAESAITARAYTLDVSRRLALAARAGGGAGFLVPLALSGAGMRLSSAAATRIEVLRGGRADQFESKTKSVAIARDLLPSPLRAGAGAGGRAISPGFPTPHPNPPPQGGRESGAWQSTLAMPGPSMVGLRLIKARGMFGFDSEKVREVALHAFSFDSSSLSGDRPDQAEALSA